MFQFLDETQDIDRKYEIVDFIEVFVILKVCCQTQIL